MNRPLTPALSRRERGNCSPRVRRAGLLSPDGLSAILTAQASGILAIPDIFPGLHERLDGTDMPVVVEHVGATTGMTKRIRTPEPQNLIVDAVGKVGVFPSRAGPVAAIHHEMDLAHTAHIERVCRAGVSCALRKESASYIRPERPRSARDRIIDRITRRDARVVVHLDSTDRPIQKPGSLFSRTFK